MLGAYFTGVVGRLIVLLASPVGVGAAILLWHVNVYVGILVGCAVAWLITGVGSFLIYVSEHTVRSKP